MSSSHPTPSTVSAERAREWLNDGQEVALLDLREAGQFGEGHPFFAIPLPFSRLELDAHRLLPRPDARVVLLDGGDGVAERGARRLQALGYTQVHVLQGGAPAWAAAGYTLFQGVNLPSKTFGELVEARYHTPHISADELHRRQQAGEPLVLLDGRTLAEHRKMTIPGAVSLPNGELAARWTSQVPDTTTQVVVHCAGRTRSIIGAEIRQPRPFIHAGFKTFGATTVQSWHTNQENTHMAAFQQRGNKWRAIVRRKGHDPISKTFTLKSDAERWATKVEREIETGEIVGITELRRDTVAKLLERYRDEVAVKLKSEKSTVNRLNSFISHAKWAKLTLADDIAGGLQVWRDKRIKEVKASTVDRELHIVSAVFSHAIQEWRVPMPVNPVSRVKRPPREDLGERDQVWTGEQFSTFLKEIGWSMDLNPVETREFVGWVMVIAKETGLRLGNVCGIRVENVFLNERYIRFPFNTTKNGDAYDCPLSTKAVEYLRQLIKLRGISEGKLIRPTAVALGGAFRRCRELVELRHPWAAEMIIHSLRHTYTTELVSKGIDQMKLLKITGRRTVKSLARYYHPKASDLANLLD